MPVGDQFAHKVASSNLAMSMTIKATGESKLDDSHGCAKYLFFILTVKISINNFFFFPEELTNFMSVVVEVRKKHLSFDTL